MFSWVDQQLLHVFIFVFHISVWLRLCSAAIICRQSVDDKILCAYISCVRKKRIPETINHTSTHSFLLFLFLVFFFFYWSYSYILACVDVQKELCIQVMLISMRIIILAYYTLQIFSASGTLAVTATMMTTMMTTMLTMLTIITLKMKQVFFHKWEIPPPPPPGCMYLCTNESTEMKETWSHSRLFPRRARYPCSYTHGLRVMDDVNKGTGRRVHLEQTRSSARLN